MNGNSENQGRELAIRNQVPVSLDETMRLGQVLARSGFFSDAREEAQAVTKVLAGRELGIPPVAAMTGIYLVKGKVSLGANLIAAQIKRSGKYDYRVTQNDDQAVVIDFYQGSERIGTSTFTAQDAKRAGLDGSDTYRKFPRNMLFARAMSNGAKWYTPDVFSGPVYAIEAEELEDEAEVGPPPLVRDVTPPVRRVDTSTGEIVEGEVIPPAKSATPPPLNEAKAKRQIAGRAMDHMAGHLNLNPEMARLLWAALGGNGRQRTDMTLDEIQTTADEVLRVQSEAQAHAIIAKYQIAQEGGSGPAQEPEPQQDRLADATAPNPLEAEFEELAF